MPRRLAEHHTASADFGEIAVDKPLLHRRERAPVDAFCAGILARRQEFLRDLVGQGNVACRVQIGVGPDRLALVGQQEIERLFGLLFVGQGSGFIEWPSSSFMIRQTEWIYYGGAIAAVGILIIVFARR